MNPSDIEFWTKKRNICNRLFGCNIINISNMNYLTWLPCLDRINIHFNSD